MTDLQQIEQLLVEMSERCAIIESNAMGCNVREQIRILTGYRQGTGENDGSGLVDQALALIRKPTLTSFNDEMPKRDRAVLVMADGNKEYTYPRCYIGSYNGREDNKQDWLLCIAADAGEFEFTHWMPLPKPPYNRHTAELEALSKPTCSTCGDSGEVPNDRGVFGDVRTTKPCPGCGEKKK